MKSLLRRPFALSLLVPLLVVAACGGGDDDGGDATGTTEPAAGTIDKITSDGEPRDGGELIYLAPSDIQSLDPQKSSSFNTQDLVGPVYSRLVAFAIGDDIDYGEQELEGDLAESWEISDDALTYTFTLRDGVRFHDKPPVNGRPLVAQDVVASMERIQREGFAAYMLQNVTSVEAPDDRTVVFRLSAPFAPLLNYLGSHYMWILPQEVLVPGYDLSTSLPVGTGPFTMERRTPNVEVVYERNPDYYGEGPHIDGVHRLVVPDQGARIAAFRAGEADIIGGLSPQEVDQVAATVPDAEVLTLLAASHLVIYVNQTEAPMSDLRFRNAISLAVDREGLGEAIYGGGQYSGPVTSSLGQWALPLDELAELYPYDPDAARAELAAAGITDARIGVLVTPGYGEQVIRAGQWIVEDLADVGITGEIELVEYGTYFGNRWPNLQYDIIVGLQTAFTEPDEWLRAQHGTKASRNWFGITDPELDELLAEQLAAVDEDERVELVHDIQRYIVEEVQNPIPIWDYTTETIASARLRDYYPDPLYGFYEYRLLWLDQ